MEANKRVLEPTPAIKFVIILSSYRQSTLAYPASHSSHTELDTQCIARRSQERVQPGEEDATGNGHPKTNARNAGSST